MRRQWELDNTEVVVKDISEEAVRELSMVRKIMQDGLQVQKKLKDLIVVGLARENELIAEVDALTFKLETLEVNQHETNRLLHQLLSMKEADTA